MSKTQTAQANNGVVNLDPVWSSLQDEANEIIAKDESLTAFIHANILNKKSLHEAIFHRICERLHQTDFSGNLIRQAFTQMEKEDNNWAENVRVDIAAYYERDPACSRFIEPVLYFKGFHAVQTYRLANFLFQKGRADFAYYLQSRASEVFQCDISPQAKLGKGIFIDHATGVVIGETASVGDNVSILHGVTLGGTGKERGNRHPDVANGVLIGAGATILGNITVGECSRVAAGSLVLKSVPEKTTVAGVPSRVVGVAGCPEPARTMNQILAQDKQEA